ncbi:MAG: hypothetical protein VYE73_17680 [Acidobacteriota bacterium]|nr:hypothetical protein [Acidobacteriota bacterium]
MTTLTLLAAALLWVALTLPLAAGVETLYFRDVFHLHFPYKAFGAAELEAARIPALNDTWALGQPFRGNPNTLSFYPGNLLYVVLPVWSAFNLHYALHWLGAGLAMMLLARTLLLGRPAAALAGLAYAGSGWMLSTLTFYNIVAVAAWWPVVMAGVVRRDRRGLVLAGLACGMALLAGEPVTAAIGLVPLVFVAVSEHGIGRGLARVGVAGTLGLVLSAPQWVATARIVGFSFRGAHGVLASQASYYSLEVRRLLELVVPFPFGIPGEPGPSGLGASGLLDHLPFYFSLHFGVVALLLALTAIRLRASLALLALAGMVLAWLGGVSGDALLDLGGGLVRFPEKLLFWVAMAVPLLAGQGLDSILRSGGTGVSRLALAGGGLAVAGTIVVVVGGGRSPIRQLAIEGRFPSPEVLEAQGTLWTLGLGAAALLLVASWWAIRSRRAEALVALQLVSARQLAPLWMTDEVAYYENLPWSAAVVRGEAAVHARLGYPPWKLQASPPPSPAGMPYGKVRLEAMEMAPAPGVLQGLQTPWHPISRACTTCSTTYSPCSWLRLRGRSVPAGWRCLAPTTWFRPTRWRAACWCRC